jgi:outer membrane protein TolC
VTRLVRIVILALGAALGAAARVAEAQTSPPALTAAPAPTSPPAHLDALGTVRFALAHQPALLAQQAQVAALVSTFAKTRAGEYPTAVGELQNQIQKSSNLNGSLAQFGIVPANNFSQNTAQLSSTYNVYNGTQQVTAEQQKRDVEHAQQELRRLEEQATVDVSRAFYNLAALHELVIVDEADLRYQQNLFDTARASEKVGRVAGVDVLRAQVGVTRSESTLLQAKVDEANASESLAVQIGAPTDTVFDVPAVLPEPALPASTAEQLYAIAKRSRPEILEARAAFQSAQLSDAEIDSDLRPTVQLSGSFGSQVSPTQLVQEQEEVDQSNAAALANYEQEKLLFPGVDFPPPVLEPPVNRAQPGFWQFAITSTFQIPLYDYGQRALAHKAARSQIGYEQAALQNAYGTVQADVNSSLRSAQANVDKLSLAKQSAELGSESARIAQLQYKSGLISFNDVNSTEQTALSAENDLVAARVNYVVSFIKLRTSLGPTDPLAAADLRGL